MVWHRDVPLPLYCLLYSAQGLIQYQLHQERIDVISPDDTNIGTHYLYSLLRPYLKE